MAGTNSTTATAERELPPGAVTKAILDWKPNGVGYTPFGGTNGPDAASMVLLKANAMLHCMAVGFSSSHDDDQCEFALLSDEFKNLALQGIGDLVLLAKILVDEH